MRAPPPLRRLRPLTCPAPFQRQGPQVEDCNKVTAEAPDVFYVYNRAPAQGPQPL